ncbi:FERM and PDZ domain-containing protein 1-like isoform X2 [Xenia sp. Carnegie-2017]|uniref:FERM and PDZ domain-containing protein 1-like isoform X2 n=1 Tax=Xenia sp. Carnegie-2017 TaxID=2897299 RepID=UPI001F03C90A|nr:FERM and PDZ domain-containing protein 1-like isoform X2 [Xenia sp. Carnegie-2017]
MATKKGQRKSSIMSRTTREKRRSNPVNVRFADGPVLVEYIGNPSRQSLRHSSLPLIPNALKIFLEIGQTRSFLYNSSTVVEELLISLAQKIGIKKLDHFCIVLHSTQTLREFIVRTNERVSQIYMRRNCSSSTWLSKLLLVFAPKDVHSFLKEDPIAFEYFYQQMCSQVVEGRFGWELKYDTAIKLAALHLQQYAMEEKNGKNGKISVKRIERELGSLSNFLPSALINTMQKKDLQRILTQEINQARNLCPPGQKYISPQQAKLQYLKICSEIKTYGGRQFNAVVIYSVAEEKRSCHNQMINCVVFVGPNVGLAQISNLKSFLMDKLADFREIDGLVITPNTDGKQNVKLFLTNGKCLTIIIGPIYETWDFVYLITGYHKHLVRNAKPLYVIDMLSTRDGDIELPNLYEVPSYYDTHRVLTDDCYYIKNGQEKEEDLKKITFVQKPCFTNCEMYSFVDAKATQRSNYIGNGTVDEHLSVMTKGQLNIGNGTVDEHLSVTANSNLNSIEEEPQIRTSNEKIDDLPSVQHEIIEDCDLEKKSYVQSSDDLLTVSTEEFYNDALITSDGKEIRNSYDHANGAFQNHASIHIQISNKSDIVSGKDNQFDVSQSPEKRVFTSKTNLSSSWTSPVTSSSFIFLRQPFYEKVDSANLKSTSQVLVQITFSSPNERNEECVDLTNSSCSNGIRTEDSVINEERTECVHSLPETKTNGILTISSFTENRPVFTNYIPCNGVEEKSSVIDHEHTVDEEEAGDGEYDFVISRKEAIDRTVKTCYLLKRRLSTALLLKNATEATNEVTPSQRQSMIAEVDLLVEYSKQIKLQSSICDENTVVKSILRTGTALKQLTDYCTFAYNGQHGLRNFCTELEKLIEKHIDVLISTDITMEMHINKCDLIFNSLELLRFIIKNM